MNQTPDFITPTFLPLGEIVSHHAANSPEVVATTQAGSATTWEELEAFSNQVAQGLIAAGIEAGARIGYLGRTTDVAFQIMHGAAKARSIFAPVNFRLAPAEVAYVLSDAQPEFLFVEDAFLPLLDAMEGDGTPKGRIVIADEPKHGGEEFRSWRDANSADSVGLEILLDDVVLLLYTSGTTGNPKGALITHEYVINSGKVWYELDEDVLAMRPGEEFLNYMPIFHNSGAVSGHYPAFARGCGIVILPDFDPELVLEHIDTRSIPMVQGVPTLLQMISQHPRAQGADFSNIRYVMYGGAPMPIPLRDRLMDLFGCRFCQGYGATEALSIAVLTPDDHEWVSERLQSVGCAMPGVEIKIVDPEGDEVPTGTVGEIVVCSPTMAVGYLDLPEASAEAFADGWYRTGDGGCLDEDGYVYLKERIKDMIISGGENIYPSEVENVLAAFPSVDAAAVVALPDEKWGEVPVAFVTVRDGERFDADELRTYVGDRLAKYKQPTACHHLDELPMNPSGKVMKKQLRELAAALHAGDGS